MPVLTRGDLASATAVALALATTCAAVAQNAPNIVVERPGTLPSQAAPEERFTGAVRVDAPFRGIAPARLSGATVTFEPGARTAWHSHPLGQTLIVTAGVGWVQLCGGPVQEMRPGDIVTIPPGAKHWHGATPSTAVTHVAITESLDGKTTDWMEKVGDDQFRR